MIQKILLSLFANQVRKVLLLCCIYLDTRVLVGCSVGFVIVGPQLNLIYRFVSRADLQIIQGGGGRNSSRGEKTLTERKPN